MKNLFTILLMVGLFGVVCVQATLRKLPYRGNLKPEAVAVNTDGIWAVAGEKRKNNGNSDFYLVKWNEAKKDWEKKKLIAEDIFDFATEGKVIGSPDGTLLILSPKNRTLYKFLDGNLEKIYEFGDKKVSDIAATNANSLFYTEIIKTCSKTKPTKCGFSTHIRKWNSEKKQWEAYGKPLPGLWEKASAGVDTTGLVGGTHWTITSDGKSNKDSKIFYWNNTDFRWEKISVPVDPTFFINKISVAKKNDIWFHLLGSANKVQLFHWDGKKLEKKVDLEASTPDSMFIDLVAIPGRVVGVDFGGNVYEYGYRKHKIETKPVKSRPVPKVGEKTISPVPLKKR